MIGQVADLTLFVELHDYGQGALRALGSRGGTSDEQRERTVKEVLEKKGVNPKAVRLILKDLDTVNEESVNNWLDDNGDLFGLTQSQEASKVSDIDRAALRQQDSVTQGALTPDRAEDLNMKLNNAESAEEIISLLRSQQ